MKKSKRSPDPIQQNIDLKIHQIRGKKVMLDRDLAALYGVETRVLNQAVKRNPSRFPSDFMFRLSPLETQNWISQSVISNSERMGLRQPPYAFTEHGILMISSVLNSERAVQVNIGIMRTYLKMRELAMAHSDLSKKLALLEGKYDKHDKQIRSIFEAIRMLMEPTSNPNKSPIGFHVRPS